MKFRIKLMIALAAAAVITLGAILSPLAGYPDSAGEYPAAARTASVNASGLSLEIDSANFSFTISKEGGGRVWHSGKRDEEDGYSETWARKVTDGFTVGYRDMNSGYNYERAITSLGASIALTEKADGCDAQINLGTVGISFRAELRAEDCAVTLAVPFDSVRESSDQYRLMYLIPCNYFDNTVGLTDGFILLPDGSGAVIDLSAPTDAKQPYSQRIYGGDRGVAGIKSHAYNVYAPQMPVYGALYAGAGGYLAQIEGGAEYAEINAYVPFGSDNPYNYAYAKFLYREEYTRYFESAGESGKSYIACQTDANIFDLKIRYLLLDENEDTLSAAAARYRGYLESAEILTQTAPDKTGLYLQYLMAEKKPSMFGSTILTMTDPDFLTAQIGGLAAFAPNLKLALAGYTKGGISGSYPQHFPLEGGQAQYKRLIAEASSAGAELSFVTDFVQAYADSSGYSKKDLAMSVAEQFISANGIPNSTSAVSYSAYNLLTTAKTEQRFRDDLNGFKKLGAESLVLNNIGGLLTSSYKNQIFSRAEQAEAYRSLLANPGVTINLPLPNQYMWTVTDAFLDTPVASSGYMIESESVPFLQMVLSGSIPMYRKPLNLNYLGELEVLRMIDYNLYPAFLLTEADAINLYGTESEYIFTSRHADWIDTVKDVYARVSAVLDKVAGQRFVLREEIAPKVFLNTYENGVRIYANYSGADFAYGGKLLEAAGGGVL